MRRDGKALMLKLAGAEDERRGGALMAWWDGDGAARVLAHGDGALLMERAEGRRSLAAMAQTGRDDAAARVLCAVAARLHAPRAGPPPSLVPLDRRLRDLWPAALDRGGVLGRAAEVARALLAEPEGPIVLHGDLHHDNVLDFGPRRGWLAIDPKGLWGERGYDFGNLFLNPVLAASSRFPASDPRRFRQRLDVVAEAAALPRDRLLRWVLAHAGLSAAWTLAEGGPATVALAVARLAAAELDR